MKGQFCLYPSPVRRSHAALHLNDAVESKLHIRRICSCHQNIMAVMCVAGSHGSPLVTVSGYQSVSHCLALSIPLKHSGQQTARPFPFKETVPHRHLHDDFLCLGGPVLDFHDTDHNRA